MEAEQQQSGRFRWLYRFSLFSLLLLMSCVAGYLSGYRWGGSQKDQDVDDATILVKTYYVRDLVTPIDAQAESTLDAAAFDELIGLVTSTVGSGTWADNGGEGEVRPFPANGALLVSNTRIVHRELEQLLGQLRRIAFELPDDSLETARAALARKRPTPSIIKGSLKVSTDYERVLESNFESAVDQLARELGPPALSRRAGERGFPEWAVGRRLAVWDRDGGKFYVTLQDGRPQGVAIVAGWWEESFGPLEPVGLSAR